MSLMLPRHLGRKCRRLLRAAVVSGALMSAIITPAQMASAQADPALGKRIYRDGLLPSGQPMRAVLQDDIAVDGTHLNCAVCHRWSGFGATEGAAFVPPITAGALYHPRDLNRADLFRKMYQEVQPKTRWLRARDPRVRPAYTDETLRIALREGKDPTGRALDPLMPRYQLSDDDIGHLIAYLKTLATTPAPGIDAEVIHFATVVTDGVAAAQREAMLDVMHAYMQRKNADTDAKRKRAGFSLYYKDEFVGAYREWKLHVWHLRGPGNTWRAQLDAYYRAQPVFAMLSGISTGMWEPVHTFCEEAEVPCLFPHTPLPGISSGGAYGFYFSKGLSGEAQALARYLAATQGGLVVQVYRDRASGRVPAQALHQALHGNPNILLQDEALSRDAPLTAGFWQRLAQQDPDAVWVLWLDAADMDTLVTAAESLESLPQIYLPASLIPALSASWPPHLDAKLFFTYPYTLPDQTLPRRYRVRAWLRSRRLALTHERIQLNTYFALSIADHALVHLVEHFSRDYFMESIEHETENALNPGVYPHLSLGPGQRFASKGSYIVQLSAAAPGGLQAVSGWIVP